MPIDPVAASAVLIEIPGAIVAIKELLAKSKDTSVRDRIESEIERLEVAVINYARMHYALSEWKELHDRLQMVERSLERLDLEMTSENIDKNTIKMIWTTFALNQLSKLQSFEKEVRQIGSNIDLTSPTQPSKIINWPEEFRSRAAAVEQEITRKRIDQDRLREQIGDLITLIRDSMTSVDRSLRTLAGELANASRELEGTMRRR